jgi:hypothetical protein
LQPRSTGVGAWKSTRQWRLVQDEATISRAHVLQSTRDQYAVSPSISHFAMAVVDVVDDGDGIYGSYCICMTQ